MPQEVFVRYRWTFEELREASRWHRRWAARWGRPYIFLLLAVFFIGSFAYSFFPHEEQSATPAQATENANPRTAEIREAPDPAAQTPADADPATTQTPENLDPPKAEIFLFVGGFVALYIGLRYYSRTWLPRRNHARSPTKDGEVIWRITEERLWIQNPQTTSETLWTAFVKALRTPTGFLLYSQPNMFQWLPKKGFANEADYEVVAGWIQRHIATIKNVK